MFGHPFKRSIGLTLIALILAGCGGLAGEPVIVGTVPPPRATTAPKPVSLPQTPPDLALGAQVYAANCTRCHGVTGKGDGQFVLSGQIPSIVDFTDPKVSQDATPIEWFEVVTNGRLDKFMPPWGDQLSEAERWAATMYVYTLSDLPERVTAGETIWTAKCAECHGANGSGTEKSPPLQNLLKTSTNQLLTTIENGIPDKMPGYQNELSPDERAAVAAYTRRLSVANTYNAPVEVAGAPTSAAPTQPLPASTEAVGAGTVNGVVTGKVTNLTSGGTIPADLALTLHVVNSQDNQSAGDIFHTSVNPDGTYRFENIPLEADRQYLVVASSGDNVFTSDMVAGDPTKPQLELPVNIYDVADDPTSIKIDGILVQVNPQANQLQVVQIVSFTNVSDRAYLKRDGGTQSSVSVRLPQGATYQDISGGVYQISADGTQIVDGQPVVPGKQHLMHVGFTLPYSGDISIDQPLDYALDGQVELMVPSGGMTIAGDQLASLGSQQLGDTVYVSYGGSVTQAAGQSLQYRVSGTLSSQTTSAAPNGVSPVAYLLIAAGLLAIGMAIGFFMRDQRTAAQSKVPDSSAEINLLMKQIADLDIQHSNGKLSKSKYERQRAALKAALMALMKSQADTDK
jgi:mono/diheme cytochrome c family protein